MGIFKIRKKVLKIRKIKDTMQYANEECYEEIKKLNASSSLCSCPFCKNNKYVKYVGTNKGMKKYTCANPNHEKRYFSTSTSYEAITIYRETMAKNLCLLTHTNSTVEGIRLYNETSKYFVEYAFEALYDFINNEINQSSIKIDGDQDLVTIFFDLSGSKLSKNKAIILAKIEDKVMFEIVTNSNYLSSHELISSIKKRLKLSKTTQIVFVTDGERCFVDSIKHFFPNAIHIRQFHSQSSKGIIYIHSKFREKDYTIRCLWDVVLNDGTPSNDVKKQRELKVQKKIDSKERKNKNIYSELSKEIMIWEGTVYLPRGVRRLLNSKTNNKTQKNPPKKKNTSNDDTPNLIFRGKIEDAVKIEVFQECLTILKKIFGGLYITSNIVETIFNIKSKFSPHRTMKFGERILVCILYCCLNLKNKKKKELINFFKENVITYELLMKKVLYGSGLQKNKISISSFLELTKEAIKRKVNMTIHYCDKFKNHTSRIIKPLELFENDYDGSVLIEAYCNLRKEKRTFYLERIRDAVIYEPNSIII